MEYYRRYVDIRRGRILMYQINVVTMIDKPGTCYLWILHFPTIIPMLRCPYLAISNYFEIINMRDPNQVGGDLQLYRSAFRGRDCVV